MLTVKARWEREGEIEGTWNRADDRQDPRLRAAEGGGGGGEGKPEFFLLPLPLIPIKIASLF